MSTKVNQKFIRDLIKSGAAVDVTTCSDTELNNLLRGAGNVERLCYSHGVNGCNGAVVSIDGQLYATGSRCSNMFIIL